MTTIKAPFNFVPLSDKVFFPDWADRISHDIPFEDGESGTIELKITAESPIFVRNGHTKEDAEKKNHNYKSFSNINGKYFIPATSIKGTIRNVLEIMSFGKMTQVENDSFSIRDLSPSDDGRAYRKLMQQQHCGWLQFENNQYILTDCGEPGRIPIDAIDRNYKTQLESFVKNNDNFRNDAGRTAKAKYSLIGDQSSLVNFFIKDVELCKAMKKNNPVDKREFVKFGGTSKGTLVLTGQPGKRYQKYDHKSGKKKWQGKYYEFVFFDNIIKRITFSENDKVINAFKTSHKNSPDYKDFWLPKLKKGEKIPVFFQYNNKEIHSIGLSYLYKYPCNKSVFNAIPDLLKNPPQKENIRIDMCEAIMGCTYDSPLRGRVQFKHAIVIPGTCKKTDTHINAVSSTPHASYYPLYLGKYNNEFQNWNNAVRIAGRKRYPIRSTVLQNNTGTENMESPMVLLMDKSEFMSQINFHNLRPIEIGALLSAITFHNNNYSHNIGYGKPLGYGKINIKAKLGKHLKHQINYYLHVFENAMNYFLKDTQWIQTPQIEELFAMAKGIPNGKGLLFEYMIMSNNQEDNQFKIGKNLYNRSQDYLPLFSQILSGNIPNSNPQIRHQNQPRLHYSFRPKNISQLEDEKGWKIELDIELHAYVKENNMISICNPDKSPDLKNIICKYKIKDLSKEKNVNPEDVIKICVVEKESDLIWINIKRIVRRRN